MTFLTQLRCRRLPRTPWQLPKLTSIGRLIISVILLLCLECFGFVHRLPIASAAPFAPVLRLAQALSTSASHQEQIVVLPISESQVPSDLLANARTIARDVINQQFQTQSQLNHFTLHLVAERSGQQVPLLTINLSRQQWSGGAFDRQFQDAGIAASLLLEGSERSAVQTPTNTTPLKRRGRGFRHRRQILEQQQELDL
ncbi:hypothetical protein ACN4EG_11015 [Alkalinema pantanalense CENA528]|uniref:hypothetical protein n=1 Tax=Alkalinema pantanalense TaxID=1620705 RepID=UPI003D6E042D